METAPTSRDQNTPTVTPIDLEVMQGITTGKQATPSLTNKDDQEDSLPKTISLSPRLAKYLEEEELPAPVLKKSSKAFSKEKYRAIMIASGMDPVTQITELVKVAGMSIQDMYKFDKHGNASIDPKLLQCKLEAHKILQRLSATDRSSVEIETPDGVDQIWLGFSAGKGDLHL